MAANTSICTPYTKMTQTHKKLVCWHLFFNVNGALNTTKAVAMAVNNLVPGWVLECTCLPDQGLLPEHKYYSIYIKCI